MVFTTRKYNSFTKKLTFTPKDTKSHVGSQIRVVLKIELQTVQGSLFLKSLVLHVLI